jgi:cytochrome c553
MMFGNWRPLVLGLAAAICCAASATAQTKTLNERIELCTACHGEAGISKNEKVPSLAGQPEFFVLNQLFLMREGIRKVEAMTDVVKDMKDEDMTALGAYFAKLPAKASDEAIDPALVKRGEAIAKAKLCASCHLPTLAGQQQMPRLAKQRVDYLVHSMTEFRDNTRPGSDTLMAGVVAGLSDADLLALAHYSASR